jgi:hypothetical protein
MGTRFRYFAIVSGSHPLQAAEHRPHHPRRHALSAPDLVQLADREVLK